jgi:hypothetical protein
MNRHDLIVKALLSRGEQELESLPVWRVFTRTTYRTTKGELQPVSLLAGSRYYLKKGNGTLRIGSSLQTSMTTVTTGRKLEEEGRWIMTMTSSLSSSTR